MDTAETDTLAARRSDIFAGEQPVLTTTALRTGEPLRLRRPQARDIDAIVTTCRDPETIHWTTVPHPYQRSDAEFFVGPYADERWTKGMGALFVIADATDTYLGSMELRLSPVDDLVADVGYVTAPRARGRGYGPAALAAVCRWGFTALGLVRIEWRANVGNTASRRMAEKAGFIFEGTARSALSHRDQRVDAWIGALLATDPVPGADQAAREMTP